MATSTEVAIATTTLGSAQSSITFNSISGSYTDLRLVLTGKMVSNTSWVGVQFNSDTGTNYSQTYLQGTGAAAQSGRYTNQNYAYMASISWDTSIPALFTMDIFSYAGSTYKTALGNFSKDLNGSGQVGNIVNLWRSTSAITRLDLYSILPTDQFASGTTATIYGIL